MHVFLHDLCTLSHNICVSPYDICIHQLCIKGLVAHSEKTEVEYPSLRVSPEVNCNQFTFHTITLSSAGACEVSMPSASSREEIMSVSFSPRSKKKQISSADQGIRPIHLRKKFFSCHYLYFHLLDIT